MITRLSVLLFAAWMLSPAGWLMAAEQEQPTIYVIKQGDTLWGLSERFIKDPKYWPDMWSKNGQVTNPHLIYPGQKLRIFPDRLELVPREQTPVATAGGQKAAPAAAVGAAMAEVAAERSYPVRGTEGFLMENDTRPAGSVIGIHNSRIIAGDDDIVYTDIGREHGVKGGEKFAIFRRDVTVSHPATNEIMGAKVIPLGTLQLTDIEKTTSRAIITRTYQEIAPGSYLFPLREQRRRDVALKMPVRSLKGVIIESYTGSNIVANGDIVYIDLGSSQGAEAGNLLYVVRDVPIDQKFSEGRVDRLPQELIGALVILEPGRRTSMALVVKSIDAIYKGDRIVSQTK